MENYPPQFYESLLNLMGSHDVVRAITALAGAPDRDSLTREQQAAYSPTIEQLDAGRKRFMAAAAVQYMMPGAPCLYYGDEIAMQGYRDPFNRAFFDWNSTEQRLRGPIKTLAALRRSCDAFDGGRLEIVRAEGDILHYRRVGVVQTAEIILNRGPHLIAEEAFGKNTEVNPGGFTVLVEDNHPEHVGYFSVY